MLLKNSENENALIIFIKNPQIGKVKTRLAATIGNEKALEVYQHLLKHTRNITENLEAEKYVFYSDFIDETDEWKNEVYQKKIQSSEPDLGVKMWSAFCEMKEKKHEKVLIIGSDCLELTKEILENCFIQLIDNEVVIGKATDGGYYLIGFDFRKIGIRSEEVLNEIFLGKQWSHADVAKEAIESFRKLNLTFAEMPTLNDIDEEKDLLKYYFS